MAPSKSRHRLRSCPSVIDSEYAPRSRSNASASRPPATAAWTEVRLGPESRALRREPFCRATSTRSRCPTRTPSSPAPVVTTSQLFSSRMSTHSKQCGRQLRLPPGLLNRGDRGQRAAEAARDRQAATSTSARLLGKPHRACWASRSSRTRTTCARRPRWCSPRGRTPTARASASRSRRRARGLQAARRLELADLRRRGSATSTRSCS